MVISNQTQYFDLLCKLDFYTRFLLKKAFRDFPGGPVANNCASNTGGRSSTPGRGTRSHMPQLRPSAAKLINFFFFFKKDRFPSKIINWTKSLETLNPIGPLLFIRVVLVEPGTKMCSDCRNRPRTQASTGCIQ